MRKIIVDIDNTLWDFAAILYERMVMVNPVLPPPSEWREFDFWRKYVSPREFYTLIRGIHIDQDAFTPYPEASSFLSSLKKTGSTLSSQATERRGPSTQRRGGSTQISLCLMRSISATIRPSFSTTAGALLMTVRSP